MKKIFFFFICLFLFLNDGHAATLKHFEVLNGKLSLSFDSNVNLYTVYLTKGETSIKANYSLVNDNYHVKVSEDDKMAEYSVYDGEKEVEKYTFYKNISSDVKVFKESVSEIKKEKIVNLHWYVISVCLVIIVILFKVIVLGFKKK